MAKKNIKEEEAQLNNESEGTQEETQVLNPESEGTQEETQEAQVVETPIKNVKIHTLEEVNCYIGGTHYSFAKGKEASVPSDVAAILTNSQKAYRI